MRQSSQMNKVLPIRVNDQVDVSLHQGKILFLSDGDEADAHTYSSLCPFSFPAPGCPQRHNVALELFYIPAKFGVCRYIGTKYGALSLMSSLLCIGHPAGGRSAGSSWNRFKPPTS